ncbi:MAG: tRNA pseudouridine(55) synthase TruB [Myxococcota bacterium]
MTRRSRRLAKERPGPSGFLVVDKPAGWTSHDVVDAARAWLGTRRVGHLGTLDPLATGALPLALRDATKLIPYLEAGPKRYRGIVRLGEETDTLDAEGQVVRRHPGPLPGEAALRSALEGLCGDIEQVPPMYSSVKRAGVPLYRLARRGEVVEREPRKIRIERLELLAYDPPDVEIDVLCSPGTFVRVLAADLGRELGCGAHVRTLRRTRSGPFGLAEAAPPELLEQEGQDGRLLTRVIPPERALGFPSLTLSREEVRRVRHGGEIAVPREARLAVGDRACALDAEGTMLAVLEVRANRQLRPLRVLGSVAAPG